MPEQNPFGSPVPKLIPACNYPGAPAPGYAFDNQVAAPGANVAVFTPVIVIDPRVIVRRIMVAISVQDGNIDVGIYDRAGKRIVSLGSTACPAVGTYFADIADTGLQRGFYYIACVADGAIARFHGGAVPASGPGLMSQFYGVQTMAAAFPLPATATLANPTIQMGIAGALEVQ